ncbi:MAG: broad specificity phosphatase PhoE [Candidatus Azotimanducaceae bacterium]|jgi:broad specificity phosphatase PhoE|tara:strand:+ start:89 stop:664 length:576 start_codon:yes stop_codon:yes gene_type:complete
MALIQLVRHGKAAAGFGSHRDPGLDDLGRSQSAAVAKLLDQQHRTGPNGSANLPVLRSSPLARAQETASPLQSLWQAEVTIEERVAEIPSPTEDLAARAQWLQEAMAGNWSDLEPNSQQWRQNIVDYLLSCSEDCIIFSHYVAINAAVSYAQGDDRMRVFAPDNCSVTSFDNSTGKLVIVDLGVTADTFVN